MRHTLPLLTALLLALLVPVHATDDVAARWTKGHLSAAYCGASPEQRLQQVLAIYRELMPVSAPPETTAGGDTMNFSIWEQDSAEVEAAKNEWLLAGRIRRPGPHGLGKAGGFLEHAGKQDGQLTRCTGHGTTWVQDGRGWQFCAQTVASVNHPGKAHCYLNYGLVLVEIGQIPGTLAQINSLPIDVARVNP